MKKFIIPAYTFTPGASGVGSVDLTGISSFEPKYLISIINQDAGVIIYSTASATKGYTSIVGTLVTLQFDTTSMSGGDVLQVIYEDNTQEDAIGAINVKLTTGTQVTASSLAVAIASDQVAIPVVSGANTNGALVSGSISGVTSETAPVNAVGFMIQALDTNTSNLRFAVGATASSSNGIQLQAGRSEQIDIAATISICPESGTQGYVIQWSKSS